MKNGKQIRFPAQTHRRLVAIQETNPIKVTLESLANAALNDGLDAMEVRFASAPNPGINVQCGNAFKAPKGNR
jgi:ribosomal protein S10